MYAMEISHLAFLALISNKQLSFCDLSRCHQATDCGNQMYPTDDADEICEHIPLNTAKYNTSKIRIQSQRFDEWNYWCFD